MIYNNMSNLSSPGTITTHVFATLTGPDGKVQVKKFHTTRRRRPVGFLRLFIKAEHPTCKVSIGTSWQTWGFGAH